MGKGIPLAGDLERGKEACLLFLPRQQQPFFLTSPLVVSTEPEGLPAVPDA